MGELAVGTATNPTGLITTTEVSRLAASEIWHDATPDSTVELASVLTQKVVTEDIIQTVTTEAVGAGVIDYYCAWYPLSSNSTLVAA